LYKATQFPRCSITTFYFLGKKVKNFGKQNYKKTNNIVKNSIKKYDVAFYPNFPSQKNVHVFSFLSLFVKI